jgi:benzoylformate decarboxylase
MSLTQGAFALIDILKNEGVKYVFGIPGATEILFMDALEKEPDIHYILSFNEIVSAGMAEGYSRAAGKPAFLNLHTGPGVAAALSMIYNAQAGKVPMVITAGQQDTRLLQYEPHLTGDIVGMGKLYCKYSTEIIHPEDIPSTIQRAFKTAMQHPQGPVLVSLPQDVLSGEFSYEYSPNTHVYSGLRPDMALLSRALKVIEKAENPVIFVESGIARCDALKEIVRFAELTGSRVYQGWMSDVNFPVKHPLYLGDLDPSLPEAKETLKDSDLLIGIGCPMFSQGFYNPEPILPKGIKIIHIDEDPWEIGKNFPVDCGIQGDIKTTLEEFNTRIEKDFSVETKENINKRSTMIKGEKEKQIAGLKALIEKDKNNLPVSVSRLMNEIDNILTPDTVIVDDCWSASGMLRKVLNLSDPKQFFRSRKGGSIGWGLSGALGVKLGLPDKKVIAVTGDGSAAWSMQSLWTAARYNIPVTYIIINNAAYRQVKIVRKQVLGDYPLTERHEDMEIDKPVIDFSMLSRSMGVNSRQVRTPDDLAGVLDESVNSKGPELIEVFVENRPEV